MNTTNIRSFLLAALCCAMFASSARAEGLIRIVQQFGTVFLPLDVIRDQHLVEKHGKALGLDITTEWHQLSGGAAVNDALLSGNIDIAGAGIGPFLTVWDRTLGTPSEVKIVGALGAQPNFLLTNKAGVKSLKDFTKSDKIALPAAGISVQARILEIASEEQFGPGHAHDLDDITVTLPHPEAAAGLISGATEITGHISNSPYQEKELKDPKIHKLFSSYDILGGKVTPTVLYALVKFQKESPKTFQAFVEALREATAWIAAHPKEAAQTFVRVEGSKLSPDFVASTLQEPDVAFTVAPLSSKKFADFLFRIGAIKHHPASWKDYVFQELQSEHGS
jgi:NitT/TauT family transport system substrate-binding protein